MISFYRKDKSHFFISTALFFIVFNPTIASGFSFTLLSIAIFGVYCVFNYSHVLRLINSRNVKSFIAGYVLFSLYCLLLSLLQTRITGDQQIIRDYLSRTINFVALLIVCVGITTLLRKRGFAPQEAMDCYVTAGFLQAILAIICYLSPSVKNFFNSLMLKDIEAKRSWSFMISNGFRNYGWASSLYDIFGYTMSIMALFALDKALDGSKRHLVAFIMISFASVINSRTTIVLIGIGSIVLFLCKEKKKKHRKLLKGMLYIFLAVGIVFILMSKSNGSMNSNFVADGYNSIKKLITTGEKTGYFDALFNEFIFFPEGLLSVVFGKGDTPMVLIGKNTDMGYIQSIWTFGVIGSIIIYCLYIRCILKASTYPNCKGIMKANLALFLVYQIKLNSIGYSQANVVLLPIMFLIFGRKEDTYIDCLGRDLQIFHLSTS